ncbi:ubiquitin-protein ligase [Lithospermum erythrorhizon]|uniref:Ubiquitin-protein ligase n=1 Tax=Lithospermum erythrorhizon TaxID=34254 RepID=A0AAV3S274_LITER
MWKSFSHGFGKFGSKQESLKPSQTYEESSDDETCSDSSSTEEGLECPICWESFNIVENVPYVLWCGHTLCKNCLLGLHWAGIKFSTQQIQIPFFVACPWCNLLTLRLLYKGNLKFPSKNFFLLWMVECRNGDRGKSPSALCGDDQLVWSPRCTQVIRNQSCGSSHRRTRLARVGSNVSDESHVRSSRSIERPHLSLQKSLDFLFRLTARIPLIFALLLFVFAVLPTSAVTLMLYLLITFLFGVPSFLVLYFAYPALDWLAREITT